MGTAPNSIQAEPLALHLATRARNPNYTILTLFDTLPWLRSGASWTAWRACLCAIYGLPMTDAELVVFKECTGRTVAPTQKAKEVWLVAGRRARKSAISALLAVWEGSADYGKHLAPGERPWIPVLAKSRDDAQQIKRFCDNILENMRWLRESSKSEEINLRTGVDIVIRAAKITAGRSRACPLALLDEVAFFPTDEAAQPDEEIIRGIRPGMANIPGAMLVGLSSPYARRGSLWNAFRDHYGKDDDPILVWRAPTLTMHDTPQIRAEVESEYAKDPENAAAEYGANFRTDVVAFVSDEVVLAVTGKDKEIPPGWQQDPPTSANYFAFCDPASGTSDSFTWSIAHYDIFNRIVVQDLLKERKPPFDPSDVLTELIEDLQRYRVKQLKGDKWGGVWNAAPLRTAGISYFPSELAKSDIYKEFLPLMTSKRVKLLDLPVIRLQLTGLDRRTARGGRDSVDHMPGHHDDAGNSTAGVCLEADTRGRGRNPPAIEEPAAQTTDEIMQRARRDNLKHSEDRYMNPPTPNKRTAYRRRGRH